MKPNQCRWCKKFTQAGQLQLLCEKCLIKSENREYSRGYDDAVELHKRLLKGEKSESFKNGFSVGFITIAVIVLAIIIIARCM